MVALAAAATLERVRRPSAWLLWPAAIALLASAVEAQPEARPAPVRGHVHLQVLTAFPRRWIAPVTEALERDLQVQVIVLPDTVPLPRMAWYPPRRRWRAERLLDFLDARYRDAPSTTHVLGLTSRDISTTKEPYEDWGILGLSDTPGRSAVASSFRTHRRARSRAHALWRMTTTAVHEMGHSFGLEHCDEPRCVMRDAEGSVLNVDDGDGQLGPVCRRRLEQLAPRRLSRISAP